MSFAPPFCFYAYKVDLSSQYIKRTRLLHRQVAIEVHSFGDFYAAFTQKY